MSRLISAPNGDQLREWCVFKKNVLPLLNQTWQYTVDVEQKRLESNVVDNPQGTSHEQRKNMMQGI